MATLAPVADQPPVSGAYRVDISKGRNIGRVSSEWFSRPDDERFLSLSALYDSVRARADRATTRIIDSRAVRVEARSDDPERLALIVPGSERPIAPTNWSFGQLCSLVGAPASYLRQLPAALAGINMQHGLLYHRGEQVKLLETEMGRTELRAVTGPDYGRIWDHELVGAVMKIAGDGVGDTRWKVPGVKQIRRNIIAPARIDFARRDEPAIAAVGNGERTVLWFVGAPAIEQLGSRRRQMGGAEHAVAACFERRGYVTGQ